MDSSKTFEKEDLLLSVFLSQGVVFATRSSTGTRIVYECDRGGAYKVSRPFGQEPIRQTKSRKQNCQFQITCFKINKFQMPLLNITTRSCSWVQMEVSICIALYKSCCIWVPTMSYIYNWLLHHNRWHTTNKNYPNYDTILIHWLS